MKNGLIFTVGLAMGAAIGALVACKVMKKKYKDIAQEEIDSVKRAYERKSKNDISDTKNDSKEEVKPVTDEDLERMKTGTPDEVKEIVDRIRKEVNAMPEHKELDEEVRQEYEQKIKDEFQEYAPQETPYVIPEEEYDTNGYVCAEMIYYADGVLCDELDEPVDDPESLVGDALKYIDDDHDSVYVRDDINRIDFEILASMKTYQEVLEQSPSRLGWL